MEQEYLLEVKNLRTHFRTHEGIAKAVENVSFSIAAGKTFGIVGESGCGKSVTALSILGLIPDPPGKIVSGEIHFNGFGDLLKLSNAEMKKIRGKEISMIFQEPMISLNPVFTVGNQIAETIRLHQGLSKRSAWDKATEMLDAVGIPSPQKRAKEYPHQMSGGMIQRAMIAMALSCSPKMMLADEPTTALDVTIQGQILDLMNDLKERIGTSVIMITHDLGVVAEVAEEVMVMYAGVVVEKADVFTLFDDPKHPYTQCLLKSLPRSDKRAGNNKRLYTIKGIVPSLLDLPKGCRFSDRCPEVQDICREKEPDLKAIKDSENSVRCWLYS